jgi:micrococcal nuclease
MKPVRAALRLALAVLLVVAIAGHAAAVIVEGTVTRVSDGDTLWVRPADGGQPIKIRLDGVDAPEICQPGGHEARQALEQLVLRQPVTVEVRLRDDYGRRVATLRREGRDVGELLVRKGFAWNYRYHSAPGPYASAENEARTARRGVFGDPAALPPREFRERHGPCRR